MYLLIGTRQAAIPVLQSLRKQEWQRNPESYRLAPDEFWSEGVLLLFSRVGPKRALVIITSVYLVWARADQWPVRRAKHYLSVRALLEEVKITPVMSSAGSGICWTSISSLCNWHSSILLAEFKQLWYRRGVRGQKTSSCVVTNCYRLQWASNYSNGVSVSMNVTTISSF